MLKYFMIVIVVLCSMGVSKVSSEKLTQKNTYYSQWSNGIPDADTFFPVNIWYQPLSRMADYKAMGMNIHIGPNVTAASHLTTLAAADMYAIAPYSATLRDAANSSRVVAWLHRDEPDNGTILNPDSSYTCTDPSVIQADYATWKSADPTRPVYLNFGYAVADIGAGLRGDCAGRIDMYPEYMEGCDIVSYDIYPVVETGASFQGRLEYVPKGIDSLRSWSKYEKPAWCWIECTHIFSTTVMPTPAETRAEVWLALMHEAGGIGYFAHEWKNAAGEDSFSETALLDRYPETKAMVTRTNLEIASLAPVLNSATVHDAITSEANWRSYLYTMVKVKSGFTYLFAGFERNKPNPATFAINGIGSVTAEVIGEGRSVTITNGSFTDDFDGYGVHIYKIPGEVQGGSGVHNSATAVQRLERTIQITSPIQSTFHLQKHEDLRGEDLKITLYSSEGSVVAQAVSLGTSPVFEWDVSTYAPGMYHALIEAGSAQIVTSFVIVR